VISLFLVTLGLVSAKSALQVAYLCPYGKRA